MGDSGYDSVFFVFDVSYLVWLPLVPLRRMGARVCGSGGVGVVTAGGLRFRALRLRMKRRRPSPTASTHTIPVCRAASCMFRGSTRTTTHFNLRSPNGVCKHLAGSARNIFRRHITTLRKKITKLTMTSKTTTVACTFRGVAHTNSRIMTTGAVCKNACGLLTRALPACNIATAFISPNSLSGFRGTVRRGAGTIFVRALKGPGSGVVSVRTITRVTRHRRVPLVVSGAFNAPCLVHPVRRKTSVIMRSTAGFVNNRKASLNNIVISSNGFS